jgi:hypothetical protein
MLTSIALGLLGGLTLTVARLIRASLLALDPAAPRHHTRHGNRIRLDHAHGRD